MRGTLSRKAVNVSMALAFAFALVPGAPEAGNTLPALKGADVALTPSETAAVDRFADHPSWGTLEGYAWEIDDAWRKRGETGLPPKDRVLEAMKAELAKGFHGAPPAPRADVERLAGQVAAARRTGAPASEAVAASGRVVDALQLWAPPFHTSASEANPRAFAVLESIERPPVRTSFFRTDGELAAPHDDPEALSGRFGIVHRWVVTPAKAPTADGFSPRLYDIASYTHLLTRPLQRAVLQRDGGLQVAPSHARLRRGAYNEHGCDGWNPGFAHGDLGAEDSAWRWFDTDYGGMPAARTQAGHVPGSVYAFYLPSPSPLPHARATVSTREQVLDPETTGFVHATTLVYDLDHDAVPDLLVWEATGAGPGHMDEPTGSDDTWYRLVLVNIGGRWKVLGVDHFSYGCGC